MAGFVILYISDDTGRTRDDTMPHQGLHWIEKRGSSSDSTINAVEDGELQLAEEDRSKKDTITIVIQLINHTMPTPR